MNGVPDVWVAVYRCYDSEDRLLYVGVSRDPSPRQTIHKNSKRSPWSDRVVRVTEEWYSNRCDALIAERRATLTEAPEYPSVVTGALARASAMAGIKADLRLWRQDVTLAAAILASSGYEDDTVTEPRSDPIDVAAVIRSLAADSFT